MRKFSALLFLGLSAVYQAVGLNHEGKLQNKHTSFADYTWRGKKWGETVSVNI